MDELSFQDILAASDRVEDYINKTPVFKSSRLNKYLGHKFYFKGENFQKVGAFKARGAMNTLLFLQERETLPEHVVSFSSGNHSQAVAWACSQLNIPCEIYMSKEAAKIKVKSTESYGAKVILCDTRDEAEAQARKKSEVDGSYILPPYDHDQVICGQGTATLEALRQMDEGMNIVAAPCGGGGLLSGTFLAAKGYNEAIQVVGGEPQLGNDACRSLKDGSIYKWKESPATIADGARTLSISERTFSYLKKIDQLIEVEEEEIFYWTQWLSHLLKLHIEPTAVLGMAAAVQFLKDKDEGQNVLVILTGGNIDSSVSEVIWEKDRLEKTPRL